MPVTSNTKHNKQITSIYNSVQSELKGRQVSNAAVESCKRKAKEQTDNLCYFAGDATNKKHQAEKNSDLLDNILAMNFVVLVNVVGFFMASFLLTAAEEPQTYGENLKMLEGLFDLAKVILGSID